MRKLLILLMLLTAGNQFIQAQEEATNTGPRNELLSRNSLQKAKATPLKAFDPSSHRSPLRGPKSFFWDFEDESQLDGWTILDDDGDGYSWEYLNEDGIKTHSGTGVISSASYDNSYSTILYPDNWLISPMVMLGGGLSFYACGQDPSWAAEVFAVYVCIGNPQNSSDFVKISGDITVGGTMKQYSFDLRPYEGQSGCIAIRHYNVSNMFRLNVDDISIGVEIPDTHETSVPEIIVEETDQDVIITATGEGIVALYVDSPVYGTVEVYDYGSVTYWVPRLEEDMYVEVWATLHDDDYELIGESDHRSILIPALESVPEPNPDDPHSYGAWLVLYDKYGEEVWKEMFGDWWYDEYYFELYGGLSLDLKTYSVIDYYTETAPYEDVLGYVMINGVRYGPETPNLNVYSGQYEYFDFVSADGFHHPLSPQEEYCFAFNPGLSCSFFAVKDGELYVGEYPHTGVPVYDSWTSVVFTDKYGNNVEYKLREVNEFDLDPESFGTSIYDGYVPFHYTYYMKSAPFDAPTVTSSSGAETDGTLAVLGVPYAQMLRAGSNNFLLPVGYTYRLGSFEGYLYALQLGPVQSGQITVNMPAESDISSYTSMRLVLTSTDGKRRREMTITDQMSYVFSYLATDKTWNVTLVNEYGDEFGRIENITIGDENVSVTFEQLSKAYTVSLTILHPSGTDVTDMAYVCWSGRDEDGDDLFYVRDATVPRQPLGRRLGCSFELPYEIYSTCVVPDEYLNIEHYVNDENNDIICQLLPNSDDIPLSYIDETTSFTVDKSNILVDNYLTFRAQVGFKEEYADMVSDVKWIIDMPSECPIYENSVLVGDEIGNYTVNFNQVTIPLSNTSGVVRFCAIPSMEGNYSANAYLQFVLNGETIMVPIGSARFCALNMSLIVPQLTGSATIVVGGTATRGKTVKVYDGSVQIGQTNCLANGSWHATCDLNEPVSPSVHTIHALVETTDGWEYSTGSKDVMYMECAPQVEWIKMLCGDYLLVFDYVNGTVYPASYTYDPNISQFTFIVKLIESVSSVRNLKFKILDTGGEVTVVDGVYDEAQGVWICTASFPSSSNVPTTVGVVYDYVWESETMHYEIIFTDYTNSVTPNAIPRMDPSGYVYEAVPSNRLQGVTATCYYKDSESGEAVLWDAEQFEQQNPLITDAKGYYRWDVPIGLWQVKYEKEGFETTYSDWLPVPPPQLDVNVGMTDLRQPEVLKAHAYPQAVELEFNKYMKPETLTTGNITVSVNGSPVNGTIQLLNEEAVTHGGQSYASRIRFNAAQPFNASKVTLRVNRAVESYAGQQMNNDCVIVLDVESEMTQIVTDATLDVAWNKSHELIVSVQPAAAAAGKTLTVGKSSSMIISTDAQSYILDENGQAVVKIHGDLPGMASLQFGIEGYDLTATTLVNVTIVSETGLKGDVNGDGEVNIADINAVIGIILGNNVDAETGERADVNGDGEVNIADINAVINIILNPANQVMSKLNCEDLLHLDDVTMNPGDVCTLSVKLDNAERYSALQCDIVLPEGLTLVGVDPVGDNERRIGEQDANAVRTLTYSLLKRPFDSPAVLNFTVRADAALAAEGLISLTNVVLADGDNKAWRAGDCSAHVNAVSGINDLTTAARVWVEGRMLCIAAAHEGVAQICTVNGIIREMNVKNGVTRHELEPGIYVVIVKGQSHKIYIK